MMAKRVSFRPVYRELSGDEKKAIDDIKDTATLLQDQIERTGAGRYQSLAITSLEQAVMWAVKGVTE